MGRKYKSLKSKETVAEINAKAQEELAERRHKDRLIYNDLWKSNPGRQKTVKPFRKRSLAKVPKKV